MSTNDPNESQDFPFGDLNKLFAQFGGFGGFGAPAGDPWKQAAQIAASIAAEGSSGNLDPLDRMAVEDLARVADLHVRQLPGVKLGADVRVEAVSRQDWTAAAVDSYRPFFERFGEALGKAGESEGLSEADPTDPLNAIFSQLFSSMAPMIVTSSAGAMLGYLGQRTLGTYDLPVPRPGNVVQVVPTTIDAEAAEWALPVQEVRLYVLIRELVAHAVLTVPHVASRLEALFMDFAAAFRPNAEVINDQIGDITDLNQLAEISETLGSPEAVLAMMRTPTHDLLMPQLDALVAAVIGFVDHATGTACAGVIPNHQRIRDAVRARIVDVTPADQFMEQLLGINIDEGTLRRGDAFVSGIVERAGTTGLERLWADELDLPTAAEVDAPGLWLARIGLDPDLPGGTLNIPDDLSGLDDLD